MNSKNFAHGIDLANPHVYHNLPLGGALHSPELMGLSFPAMAPQSVRVADPHAIFSGQVPLGFVGPRLAYLLQQVASAEVIAAEIAFERVRRQVAPQAASRLCCIWLAEDSTNGRQHIERMFASVPALYIIKARVVSALRITRANTKFFELYFEQGNDELILNYWAGIDCPGGEWEFLVEGAVQPTDPNEVAYVKAHGTKLPGWGAPASLGPNC